MQINNTVLIFIGGIITALILLSPFLFIRSHLFVRDYTYEMTYYDQDYVVDVQMSYFITKKRYYRRIFKNPPYGPDIDWYLPEVLTWTEYEQDCVGITYGFPDSDGERGPQGSIVCYLDGGVTINGDIYRQASFSEAVRFSITYIPEFLKSIIRTVFWIVLVVLGFIDSVFSM